MFWEFFRHLFWLRIEFTQCFECLWTWEQSWDIFLNRICIPKAPAFHVHSYVVFCKFTQQIPNPQRAKNQTFSLTLNNSCRPFTLHDFHFFPANWSPLSTYSVYKSPLWLPVWLLMWIFSRQALSYCLLQPGKEQENCSCSLKWARLWENNALTVINVLSQPGKRRETAHQVDTKTNQGNHIVFYLPAFLEGRSWSFFQDITPWHIEMTNTQS